MRYCEGLSLSPLQLKESVGMFNKRQVFVPCAISVTFEFILNGISG